MRTHVAYPPEPVVQHEGDFKRLVPLTQGDIAEFGVFEGGSTIQLAQFGRPVFAFDTFDGMPGQEFTPTVDHNLPGEFKPRNNVLEMLKDFTNVTPVVGRFSETLPTMGLRTFGFVYLDADLLESYRQVFEFLFIGHLNEDFVILADDYNACKGAKIAVDELMKEQRSLWMNQLNGHGVVISNMDIKL